MIKYPRWYRDLPINIPRIPRGGTNREGLTWAEWENAARFVAGRPKSMLEESWWAKAWACGMDPAEMHDTGNGPAN